MSLDATLAGQPAYWLNGAEVSAEAFYAVACDPQRSVAVEACAGAGKTWMLVSRILRALAEGTPPGQILAITFTRKAAGEMRERLSQWLREMALCTHEQRCHELRTRGATEAQAQTWAPALAQLHARWLETAEGPQISTIHGWFSKLVRGLPLDTLAELGLPAQLQLLEDTDEIWPRLWGRFLQDMDQEARSAGDAPSHERVAFEHVLVSEGRSNLETWLRVALGNRLELDQAARAGVLWDSVPSAQTLFEAFASFDTPLDALASEVVQDQLKALAQQLGQIKTKAGTPAQKSARAAQGVVDALQEDDLQSRFDGLYASLFTDKGEPRKQLGDAQDLPWAHAWLADLSQAVQQHKAAQMHRAMVLLSQRLFELYARLKREMGLIDMTDLELAAAQLHQSPELAGWVQERLDVQISQVLMDEFQDTSPLQWATLHAWLASYAGAGGGGSGRQPPRVFVVGDPKQSIYRFRRADPRVFGAAREFVCQVLGGDHLACDHTRRNAPGIIALLNRTMQPAALQGLFQGFRPHTTAIESGHCIRVLPEVLRSARDTPGVDGGAGGGTDGGPADDPQDDTSERPQDGQPALAAEQGAWRDSLTTPRHEAATALRQQEAAHVANAIAHLIHHEQIDPADIFVLARKRASLGWVAEALADRGIAHAAPENTLLVETPEARDVLAVVEAVTTPMHDLALAHALRSPAFGASDRLLMAVARQVNAHHHTDGQWWDALMALSPDAPGLEAGDAQTLQRAQHCLPLWRDAAARLPAHDLMQKIIDTSGWRMALARSLSAPMLRQALAHLDALLGQALALQGGRDATPYRWLRELRRLREPLPSVAVQGVVQLLTIHGAKGLEAKAVFMIDCDGEPPRSDHHTVLVDWPQGADHPARCAFVAKESAPPPSMQTWLEHERHAQHTEECNALYVALTRAKQMLCFSRTQPSRPHPLASWWQRLTDSGALADAQPWPAPMAAGQALASTGSGSSSDSELGMGEIAPVGLNHLSVLPKLPRQPCLDTDQAPTAPFASPAAGEGPPPQSHAPLADASAPPGLAQTGRVLHRVLELLTPIPVANRSEALIDQLVQQARAALQAEGLSPLDGAASADPTPTAPDLSAQVMRIVNHPESAPWLDPAQVLWAGNEVVLWHQGQMLRIDRLVSKMQNGQPHWWVLDYKMHLQPETVPAHRQQMQLYIEAVAALEPGSSVHGAFINGEGALRVFRP